MMLYLASTLRVLLTPYQLEADLLNLIYGNVLRFDENIESDRAGVYHVLSMNFICH